MRSWNPYLAQARIACRQAPTERRGLSRQSVMNQEKARYRKVPGLSYLAPPAGLELGKAAGFAND